MWASLAEPLRGWLRVCGVWGIVHLWLKEQPLRRNIVATPPQHLLRSCTTGEAWVCAGSLVGDAQHLRSMAVPFYFQRLPCVKGAVCVSRLRDCSFLATTLPSRLRRATSPYTGEAKEIGIRSPLWGAA